MATSQLRCPALCTHDARPCIHLVCHPVPPCAPLQLQPDDWARLQGESARWAALKAERYRDAKEAAARAKLALLRAEEATSEVEAEKARAEAAAAEAEATAAEEEANAAEVEENAAADELKRTPGSPGGDEAGALGFAGDGADALGEQGVDALVGTPTQSPDRVATTVSPKTPGWLKAAQEGMAPSGVVTPGVPDGRGQATALATPSALQPQPHPHPAASPPPSPIVALHAICITRSRSRSPSLPIPRLANPTARQSHGSPIPWLDCELANPTCTAGQSQLANPMARLLVLAGGSKHTHLAARCGGRAGVA